MRRWRPIPGFDGDYLVSDDGQVRSAPGKHWREGKIRALVLHPSRHYNVSLTKDGAGRMHAVHRLVALAFLGAPPPGHEVCHRDGDGLNNRVGNLYWGTRAENMQDKVRHGGHHSQKRTHCPRGHELVDPNLTASGKAVGRRRCLACSRMGSYVKNHSDRNGEVFTDADRQQIADQYLDLIKKGINNVRTRAA